MTGFRYFAAFCAMLLIQVAGSAAAQRPQASAPPQERSGYVTTPDSVRLWYRIVGSGPETVIIPAALYHRNSFDRLAVGRQLVLYDPRRRGQSDTVPSGKVSIETDLADLETIRQMVDAPSFALIAWSALGAEYFMYALKYPGRVTRIVQLSTVPPRMEPYWNQMRARQRSRIDSTAQARLNARVAAGEFKDREADLCREMAKLSNPVTFGDPKMGTMAPDVCDSPNEWPTRYGIMVRAILASFGNYDWRPNLEQVTIPRLVIHGDRDNWPLEGAREWVVGQPNARFLVLPGVGHWPHYERPNETLGAIDEFLKGRWPAGSQAIPR